MKRNIIRIFIALLTTAVSLSCSMAFVDNDSSSLEGDCMLIVTGSVSDVETSTPLKGIKISFNAYPQDGSSSKPLLTQTVYSDSNGIYAIEAEGFEEPVTCRITAKSPDMKELPYKTAVQEVNINWSDTGYDAENNRYFINDCNFKLSKVD